MKQAVNGMFLLLMQQINTTENSSNELSMLSTKQSRLILSPIVFLLRRSCKRFKTAGHFLWSFFSAGRQMGNELTEFTDLCLSQFD